MLFAQPGLQTVVATFPWFAAGSTAPGVSLPSGRPISDAAVSVPPATVVSPGRTVALSLCALPTGGTADGTGAPPDVRRWSENAITNAATPKTIASPASRLVVIGPSRCYRTVNDVLMPPDRCPRSQLM